jgi:putative Holliday junction resolvase
MKFLGIDYGEKRIGLALADSENQIATPHATIKNDEKILTHLAELIDEHRIEQIVLGKSTNFSGADNPVMKQIRSFRGALEDQLDLPVIYVPEFFTSAQARRQPEAGRHVDGSAAALILQSFLDTNPHEDTD